MAPLGSFIRLTPLQLEELPSHPSLETLFSTPYSRNGTRPKSHPQALKDVSNALQDIPQSQSNAQQDHSYNLKNDSEAPTGNPVNSNGTSEDLRDGLHTLGPSHSDVLDHTGRPNLIPFIKTILDEATTFVDETITSTFSDGGLKSSPPSIAKVKLLKRTIAGSELSQIPWEKSTIARKPPQGIAKSSEAWFARSSKHANRNLKGTTSWSEIDFALRSDHSQHERMYTPDVFDDFKVLEWDFGAGHESIIGKYSDITMGSEYPKLHFGRSLADMKLRSDHFISLRDVPQAPFPPSPACVRCPCHHRKNGYGWICRRPNSRDPRVSPRGIL